MYYIGLITTLWKNNTVYYSKHLSSICAVDHVLYNIIFKHFIYVHIYHRNMISISKSIFYCYSYLNRMMYCLSQKAKKVE